MRKFIIKLLTFWILPKSLKRKIQADFNSYSFWDDQLSYLKFKYGRKNGKKVAVIEPNEFHGEVVPGFVKYWLDLGYNVDVLLTNEVAREKPLFMFNDKAVRVLPMSRWTLLRLMRINKIAEYDFIMLTSSIYKCYDKAFADVADTAAFRNKLFVVEHDTGNISGFKEIDLLASGRLVTIKKFDVSEKETLEVCPHYFGEIKEHQKSNPVNFIVVGGIVPERKNHKLLFAAIDELLTECGDNFKITVVGMGRLKDIPQKYHRFLDIKGRLNFPDMCFEMQKADFILPLLDVNSIDHERYITTGVTGTLGLVLGFRKPCVISGKFASFYEFNDSNAVVYTENDLTDGMSRAMQMKDSDYSVMRKILCEMSDEIYKKSLNNLKKSTGRVL